MERTKVLFATAPFDGHFNPLTTLALALQQVGYDVRWYTQEKYAPKLAKLQIPHFPFRNALQFHDGNMDELFPRRAAIKSKIAKLNLDIQEIFVKRGPEYYDDLLEIHKTFPFDIMVADLGFTGIQNQLPMVVAGIHEGKNEICTRVGYFKLGINLKTETPTPALIREAVDKVSRNWEYASNVKELAEEFSQYDPAFLIKKYVYLLTRRHGMISKAA
jgi:UDP:flavonoid glycosyltransferase YjiC (YdhE family)